MEFSKFLALLAAILPVAYGAPTHAANSLHPEILAAMKRDLGLDTDGAAARVAWEHKATEIIDQLRSSTGSSYAGAWISEDGSTLHVGVTDKALADEVTAAGAKATIFPNSLSKLKEAKQALDNLDLDSLDARDTSTSAVSMSGVAAYYVDVAANKVVFEALRGSNGNAKALASHVGLDASEFEVRTVDTMPSTFATVRGGDAYYIDNAARCSIGFSVTTGFVSAGHCGSQGSRATPTLNGPTLGTFAGSVFPGNADMSYVRTVSGSTLSGTIDGYGGANIRVSGSTVAASGSTVCRSGSTTGVHCGTVGSMGATVNYSEGRVTGLTQTNVCAEPGDSGGSFYAGSQAQGVTSGGNGDCSSGGITYFQPVNEILQTYGLTLVKG